MARQKSAVAGAPVYRERNTVSKSAFNALLLALLIVGGLAVYGLFFNKSVVGGANASNKELPDRNQAALPDDQTAVIVSENQAAAKKPVKEEKRKAAKDSLLKEQRRSSQANRTTEPKADDKPDENEDESGKVSGVADEKKAEQAATTDNTDDNTAIRYKVRNKAYFHNEPNADTRREAFIVHWNNAVLEPRDEKNGFVYIVFTNHLGQVSKGWIPKADLVAVK
jgi:hypothetical protein